MAPPAGEFFLADLPQRPVVLLSGGVGLTPMVAMLETIAEHHPHVPAYFIHGTHNRETHAMRGHVRALAKRAAAIQVTDFHQTPVPGASDHIHYEFFGPADELLAA